MTQSARTIAVLLISISFYFGSADAATWIEIGDASDSPQLPQITSGSGSLDQIQTMIGTATDTDSFAFRILDPASFSINLLGTSLSSDNDTEIYITDRPGNLIFQNDDFNGLLSGLAAGSFPGEAGEYVFSVNLFSSSPIGNPVTGFNINPAPAQTGQVLVNLTGAAFAVVPEPSAALLFGMGSLSVALRRRR